MAQIKVVFNPDTSKMSNAIKDIKKQLESVGNVRIQVDTAGARATQQFVADLRNASKVSQELTGNLTRLATTYKGTERSQQNIIKQVKQYNEGIGATVVQIDELVKGQHRLTTTVTEDSNKRQKAIDAENKAYVAGFKQAEAEIRASQQAKWKKFLQEQQQYNNDVAALEEQKVKQAQDANKRMVQDEADAQRRRSEAWKSYIGDANQAERQAKEFVELKRWVFEQYRKWDEEDEKEAEAKRKRELEAQRKAEQEKNKIKLQQARYNRKEDEREAKEAAQEAERQAKANAKAADKVDILRKQYASLLSTIERLKAMYPAGTFDEIEREAREAQQEVQNFDKTSNTLADDVKKSEGKFRGLSARLTETRQETQKLDKVTESFWMNIQKFARWYFGGNIVVHATRYLKEALKTMKEVDTELANIQKVTDRTDAQMRELGNTAYGVASKYGIEAEQYLESVATFAKAGYGDKAENLAELATKAQLVGDTTAEVANKFLIAGDAAWKMGGDIDELSHLLDAANTIENNYATSIDKLAQGFPIVASVAAQAGMSMDETMAALGTITSVTQETGTKAATALRALILNIIGAVGEYEDGMEVTEESVKSLDGLLQIYAKDALQAAKASGTVVNPMEAIAALAKASKEGLLNQAELFEVLSSLGGKLRTNQLTALVQNFDMLEEILDRLPESAGSADNEIQILLKAWESKTKILKNTWTEFIAKTIDSGMVKWLIDAATGALRFADNLGLAATAIGGIALAIKSKDIIGGFKDMAESAKSIKDLFTGAASGFTQISTGIVSAAGIATAAISAVIMAYKAWDRAREERVKTGAQEAKKYDELLAKYDDAVIKINDETTSKQALIEIMSQSNEAYDAEAGRLKDVNALREEAIKLIGEEGKAQAKAYVEANTAAYNQAKSVLGKEGEALTFARSIVAGYTRKQLETGGLNAIEKWQLNYYQEQIDKLSERVENAQEVVETYERALAVMNGTYEVAAEETNDLAASTDNLAKKQNVAAARSAAVRAGLQSLSDKADIADTAIAGIVDALSEFGEGSLQVYDAMSQLESAVPGSTDKLYDFETASLKIEAAQIADKESLLDFIQTSRTLDLSDQIRQLEDAAAASWNFALAIASTVPGADATTLATQMTDPLWGRIGHLKKEMQSINDWVDTLRGRSSYRGGSSSGSTGSSRSGATTDPELERRKEAVALLKSELEFLKAKGATQDEQNAKQREIQAALHDQAEYMRLLKDTQTEITIKQSDINALSTEWWKIQSELSKQGEDELDKLKSKVALLKSELDFLRESGASEDEIIAKQREIQDALHKQAEHMRSIKADKAEINALSTEWWRIQQDILKTQEDIFNTLKASIDEYYDKALSDKEKELEVEEKILAVQKAQIALENAQNERTVRYYNAATGQWERMADANKVKSAHDNLKNAQDALNQYNKQQAEDEFKKAWEYVAQKIKDGAMTFDQAYKYMYDKMKDIQDKYDVDMSGVLNDSIGGFKGLNITIRDLDKKTADELGKATDLISQRVANLNTAMGKFKSAVDKVAGEVKSGKKTFEEAYDELKKKAKEIADKYGVDLTGALDTAVTKMKGVYSGLDGISKAVQEGALTPDEAFDIISKALNAVSEKYGENISKEVDAILEGENGFKGGLSGLVQAVKDGKIDINTAFGLVESATKKVSDKYGKDMTKELNSAIQNMGKSGDAIEDLWKQIVIAKMKANSVAWYDADEDERKALHAENDALGALIGADYDATGYWSLGGRHIYDPAAERGATGGTSTAGEPGTTTTGRVKATPASIAGANATMANPLEGVNLDSLTPKQKATVLKSALTAGNWVDVMNTLNAAGDTPVDIGEDGTPTGMLHAIDGFVIGSKLVAVDGYVPHTGWEGTTTEHPVLSDLNGNYWMLDKETGELTPVPETATYKKLAQKVAFNEENVHAMYDSGGILRGMGGIKATDRDELILPPDITSKMLDPINNEYTMRAFDALRWMLGGTSMPSSTVNNRIGSQHNGNVYEIGGIRIGEERARSTTVYDIAQLAQSLSISKEGN